MKIEFLRAETLTKLINVVSDISIILDQDGVVEEVSIRKTELSVLSCQSWIGKPWADAASVDSRAKILDILHPDRPQTEIRWRHINHTSTQGASIAVQYAVLHLEDRGKFLVLGRDLEAISVLQRRLVETQQSMERDYLRLRHVETRYRMLFDTTAEAVMLVDGLTYRILEANAGAQALVKGSNKKLIGRDLQDCFEAHYREDIQSLLRMSHATGRIEICRVKFTGAASDCTASASVFRQEGGPQFLVRLLPMEPVASPATSRTQNLFSEALEHSPDGFALTDRSGKIKSVNVEFLSMLGATAASQLVGQPLESWLVRGGVDWGVLQTNLRSQSIVREFATEIRSMAGGAMAVEISALALVSDETHYAFYVKDVVRRRSMDSPGASGMAGSVAELSRLVGRMPMKDIVGETIDMIEKMCIQSALNLTGNNRASAAEMLGLSRQSLYVKLRRFGMVSEADAIN